MMANETIRPTPAKPATNGLLSVRQSQLLAEVDATVLRASRILSGDIQPDDYLPISNDILAFVADAEARTGVQMLSEYRQKMISELALQAHHAGNIVLTHHTANGVIVIAVGVDEIDRILESLPPDKQALTKTEYPAPMIDNPASLWE